MGIFLGPGTPGRSRWAPRWVAAALLLMQPVVLLARPPAMGRNRQVELERRLEHFASLSKEEQAILAPSLTDLVWGEKSSFFQRGESRARWEMGRAALEQAMLAAPPGTYAVLLEEVESRRTAFRWGRSFRGLGVAAAAVASVGLLSAAVFSLSLPAAVALGVTVGIGALLWASMKANFEGWREEIEEPDATARSKVRAPISPAEEPGDGAPATPGEADPCEKSDPSIPGYECLHHNSD